MKDMGIIQGSAAQAVPLIVGKDRVDVHTDITPVTQDNEGNPVGGSFQCHEIQYDKDEYLKMMFENINNLETTQAEVVDTLATMLGVV